MTGPFRDFDEAQSEMRREARYYRARNGYIIDADDPGDALEAQGGLEFACDYGDDILDAATA
jgi:hypothetical protein